MHPFRNFLVDLPPPTLYEVETRKKCWKHASNIVCGVRGEGGLTCVNWKTSQKCKSVPRLLSMIVVLHYTAVQVCKNRNLSYSPIIILTIQRAGRRHPFPDTNRLFHRNTLTFDLDWILSLGKSVKSSSLKVKVETYETR